MKKSVILFLIPLMLILVAGIVAAQFPWSLMGVQVGDWQLLIVYIVTFTILVLAFGDILSGFTMFSTWVSWIIGIGLAIVGILTGFVRWLAVLLLQIGAGFGVVSVFIAIGTAFLAFALMHIGPVHWLKKGLTWAKARQKGLSAYTSTETVKTGFRALKAVGKEASK